MDTIIGTQPSMCTSIGYLVSVESAHSNISNITFVNNGTCSNMGSSTIFCLIQKLKTVLLAPFCLTHPSWPSNQGFAEHILAPYLLEGNYLLEGEGLNFNFGEINHQIK